MADSEEPNPESNDPGRAQPPAAKPLAPAPRVNPPNINAAKEAPPAGGPPGFTDFLEWMRNQTVGEPAPGSTAQRGLIPKEKKKFQRRDTDAKTEKVMDSPSPGAEPANRETPERAVTPRPSGDVSAPADSPVSVTDSPPPVKGLVTNVDTPAARVRRQQAPLKRNTWLGVILQLGVLLALVGSFLFGRLSVSKVVAPSVAPAAPEVINSEGKVTTRLLSDANAALIDQAMTAVQDTDFKKAADLLGQVKNSGEHVQGLTFQLAQVAIFAGDYNRAVPLLNNSLSEGENLADVYNLRATITGRGGMIKGNGMNDYETATKIDPFGSRNFFFWGEALRRAGKDQAAIVRLKQAVDRLRDPELESLYRLKLRLAQVEAGQEKEFADEMEKHLALPNPPMDWLITAAAVEMHNGKFDAAAGYLDRAAQRGDPDILAGRLRDFYLHQFEYQKELRRFFSKTAADKPDAGERSPPPADSPGLDVSSPPAIGLDVPSLPPPASPGATVPH